MKARKTLTLLLLAALTFAACKYDDSELWEQVNQNTEELAAQAARIAALEAWQTETNTNIEALQTLLSTTDYITAVTPVVKDGVEVGFTISFLNTPAITIYHGTKGDKGDKGDTSQIGATQADDGNWYWTLNGELLTDIDGNPIRANGTQGEQGDQGPAGDDAPLPQLATGAKLNEQQITTDSQGDAIAVDAIYLSVDGGATWTRVSGKKGDTGSTGPAGPQGDSFFDSVDYTSNPDYVTFTLANSGGSFSVPRYMGISLTFNPTSLSLLYDEKATIECTAEGSADFTTDNLFIVAPAGWKADIALTRSASTGFTLTVTAPDTDSEGEILVMLDNKKGSTTIGRIPVFCGTKLAIGNHQPGQLAAIIGNHTDLTSITVTSGEINDDDWEAIKRNEWTLQTLDLAGATYNTNDLEYVKIFYADPVPLTTAKLPQGVTGLSVDAFVNCKNLTSINIPEGLKSIGENAFQYCTALTSIELPDGVTSIGYLAFGSCSALTSVDLPASLTSIGSYAFEGCSALTSIELPAALTSIGGRVFAFSGIQTLTCRATTPPDAGSDGEAFYDATSISEIRVPAGAVEAYKQTPGWNWYSIVAIPKP
ncbi:leucine-rich repeat protein [uncultured Bacteroides sp.]|uniref:leucine-rich repeat protein n=1 Tax=uncultured Bacteroides sp. TaxID=162156 RepID=UPI00262265D5|nr:leucine-rich repeat protein [uncultured Bacteroides sp.]